MEAELASGEEGVELVEVVVEAELAGSEEGASLRGAFMNIIPSMSVMWVAPQLTVVGCECSLGRQKGRESRHDLPH